MKLVLTRAPAEFAERAGPLLEERIECNILATVLSGALEGRFGDRSPLFAYGLDASGAVALAVLRTPGWFMLASPLEPELADELVGRWLVEDPNLPGVNAVPVAARAIAEAWRGQTGGVTRCRMSEAMHSLTAVTEPPRPARGRLRAVVPEELSLLMRWLGDFEREAEVSGAMREELVAARIARGEYLVWEDGEPVSLVGTNRPVGGVVRIGPVYTPPEFRRLGYAGSAVAVASRRALAAGADTCMLFTDLANPTSNKIYAEVGYRRIGDWEEHEFVRDYG
ncbi:MAG TPA: GNAT family N-acetyltransferase [Thermoleophilaceae bacterium]|nr:GNAT family N-acetyltransferase [Thermoleophilaceae bacterium]